MAKNGYVACTQNSNKSTAYCYVDCYPDQIRLEGSPDENLTPICIALDNFDDQGNLVEQLSGGCIAVFSNKKVAEQVAISCKWNNQMFSVQPAYNHRKLIEEKGCVNFGNTDLNDVKDGQ